MAGTTGLEPATSAVTGQRSNQLSYVPKWFSSNRGFSYRIHRFAGLLTSTVSSLGSISPGENASGPQSHSSALRHTLSVAGFSMHSSSRRRKYAPCEPAGVARKMGPDPGMGQVSWSGGRKLTNCTPRSDSISRGGVGTRLTRAGRAKRPAHGFSES